jgi:ABC-2 type transport system ATP-binding protein
VIPALAIKNLVKTYPAQRNASSSGAKGSADTSGPNGVGRTHPDVKSPSSISAVDGVSFEIAPGEVFGLLGPNGAGKTSIISCVVTLERPTQGQVEVFGYDVEKDHLRTKMLVGFVPQELIHHGFFDVEEIMGFHSGYFGRRHNGERVRWLLERLSLWEHRKKKVKQLSGGMKRRLLIAKALVHEPKILLLDEPTAGVDIELRSSLWRFVDELRKDGLSILLTTHYIEEAEELCDRVGILQRGQLKRVGPTRELVASLTTREIIFAVTSVPDGVKAHRCFRGETMAVRGRSLVHELRFQIPATATAGELMNDLSIRPEILVDVRTEEGNLEDALVKVLSEAKA